MTCSFNAQPAALLIKGIQKRCGRNSGGEGGGGGGD